MRKLRRGRRDTLVVLCEPYGSVCDASSRAREFDDRRRIDATLVRAVGFVR